MCESGTSRSANLRILSQCVISAYFGMTQRICTFNGQLEDVLCYTCILTFKAFIENEGRGSTVLCAVESGTNYFRR